MEYVEPPPPQKDAPYRPIPWLVVVGASRRGGLGRLAAFVAALPPGLPAAVLVALSPSEDERRRAPAALRRAARLSVVTPFAGEALHPGVCYLADVEHQLSLTADGEARLVGRSDHDRSLDLLFEAAGRAAGARTVAVALDGEAQDGAAGLAAVRAAGGTVLVAPPPSATVSGPAAAAKLAQRAAKVVGRGD